jgi:hypothetical protein
MKAAIVFQQSPSSKSLLDVEETGRCIDQLSSSTVPADSLSCQVEMSKNSWLLGIQFPDHQKPSVYPIKGGDSERLNPADRQADDWRGTALPPRLAQEIKREIGRLALVQDQIAVIEQERDESPTTCKATEKKRAQLLLLKGIGPIGSAIIAREVYSRVQQPTAGRRRSQGISRAQWPCAGNDDPDGLVVHQTSAQECDCPVVRAAERWAERAIANWHLPICVS